MLFQTVKSYHFGVILQDQNTMGGPFIIAADVDAAPRWAILHRRAFSSHARFADLHPRGTIVWECAEVWAVSQQACLSGDIGQRGRWILQCGP